MEAEPAGEGISKRRVRTLGVQAAEIAGTVVLTTALYGLGPDPEQEERKRGPAIEHRWDATIEKVVVTHHEDRLRYDREATREELDVILDSMLITNRVEPGTPFEERVGHVDDPRIRELMQEIDDTLGGRVEWPNVYVADLGGLRNGQYKHHESGSGRTTSHAANEGLGDGEKYGISLNRDLVEEGFSGSERGEERLRHTLVHELQHAASDDNRPALVAAASKTWAPERSLGRPYSETRAELAEVVVAELMQRGATDGPKLNDLPAEDRREVIAGLLTQYLTPKDETREPSQDVVEARLSITLKENAYLTMGGNDIWWAARDDRTEDYATGTEAYDGRSKVFVPTDMDPVDRHLQLATPLDELATQFRAERKGRIQSYEEWLATEPGKENPDDRKPRGAGAHPAAPGPPARRSVRGDEGQGPSETTGTGSRGGDDPPDGTGGRRKNPTLRERIQETASNLLKAVREGARAQHTDSGRQSGETGRLPASDLQKVLERHRKRQQGQLVGHEPRLSTRRAIEPVGHRRTSPRADLAPPPAQPPAPAAGSAARAAQARRNEEIQR